MPANKKPRKRYQPGMQKILNRINGKSTLNDGTATDLELFYRMDMETLVRGESSKKNLDTIIFALDVALILAETGIGNEYAPNIQHALDWVFKALVRGNKTGVWRFDGNAIMAVNEALEIHAAQIRIATCQEMRNALGEVKRRLKIGHVYTEEDIAA